MRKASVALIIKDGMILAVSRSWNNNKYGIIGGKLELNETPKEAVIREVQEEAGIKIISCEEIYSRLEEAEIPGDLDFYTYCFYATEWSGNPRSSEEGEVRWITKDNLLGSSGAFPEYNKNTLNALREKFPKVYNSLL